MKNINHVIEIEKMALKDIQFQWTQLKSTENKVNYEFYYRVMILVYTYVKIIEQFGKNADWSRKLNQQCKKSIKSIRDKLKDKAFKKIWNPYR